MRSLSRPRIKWNKYLGTQEINWSNEKQKRIWFQIWSSQIKNVCNEEFHGNPWWSRTLFGISMPKKEVR